MALAVGAALLGARPARGQARDVELDWDAPAGCARAADVSAAIAALRGGPAVVAVRARARITRDEGGAWVLALTTEVDGAEHRRDVRAATCAELSDAAAIVLALETAGQTAPASGPPPPLLPLSPPPPPAAPASAERPAVVVDRPATGEASLPMDRQRRFAAGASAAASTGAIGPFAAGLALSAAWTPGRERVELAVAYFPYAHVDRADLGIGGDFSLFIGAAAACHLFAVGRALLFGPCAGAEVGRVGAIGTGQAVQSPEARGGLWLAPKGAGLAVVPLGRVGLRLELTAVVPLLRNTFVIQGVDQVYRPSAVAGRLLFGAEATFP